MSAQGLIILLTIALTASVSAILLQRRRHRARMATHTGALLELAGMHRSFATQQELAAVGSLTAPFAHTANNRLTVILSCLEMIGDTATPPEDRLKAVALADEAARRLTTDMNALLAAARRQPAQLRIVELELGDRAGEQYFLATARANDSCCIAGSSGNRSAARSRDDCRLPCCICCRLRAAAARQWSH